MANYTDPTVVTVGKGTRIHPGVRLAVIAGVLAMVVAAFFYVESLRVQNNKKEVEKQIVLKEARLRTLQPTAEQLELHNNQARQLHTLFDNQKRWEAVLAHIESRLYKNMQITSLQFNEQGTFTLSGITPDYVNYAKIFRSLTDAEAQKTFVSAKPTAIGRTEGTTGQAAQVTFSFNLTLQPNILKLQPTQ